MSVRTVEQLDHERERERERERESFTILASPPAVTALTKFLMLMARMMFVLSSCMGGVSGVKRDREIDL